MDGVSTVKAAIAISNRACSPLCFAKLDITAPFDSLSHRAVVKYLLQGSPNLESLALWDLLISNEIILEVGGESWRQTLQQGILRGRRTVPNFSRASLHGHWTPSYLAYKQTDPSKLGE